MDIEQAILWINGILLGAEYHRITDMQKEALKTVLEEVSKNKEK